MLAALFLYVSLEYIYQQRQNVLTSIIRKFSFLRQCRLYYLQLLMCLGLSLLQLALPTDTCAANSLTLAFVEFFKYEVEETKPPVTKDDYV